MINELIEVSKILDETILYYFDIKKNIYIFIV